MKTGLYGQLSSAALSSPVIKIFEKPVIPVLSVFAPCRAYESDLKAQLGVIGPCELNGELIFQIRPRTSGKNR